MSRLSWVKTALEVGVVTKKYPYEDVEVPEGFRGLPEFDAVKCIGCASCANVCTPDAIRVVEDVGSGVRRLEYRVGKCIFCGRCAEVCPVSAITISKEFELAYKGEVVHVIELRYARCSVCGKPFTTSKHLTHVEGKLSEVIRENVDLCPDCKRRVSINSIIQSAGAVR
ncbi:MAG: 4Fe-4S dicluster domain-containing protein [Sulfolobales archaeon]